MIIVEERFGEIFNTFPQIVVGGRGYDINYNFGSHTDLIRYMKSKTLESGGVSYPLIWLETPIEREVRRGGTIELRDVSLILATLSDATKSNIERLEITFKPTLIPLYKKVMKGLRMSGFTTIIDEGKHSVTNFYNFGVVEKEHGGGPEIWDVLKIKVDLIMSSECSLLCKNK